MKKIYGFTVLPKAGLANMLIPWAECFLWSKDQGIKQVAPFWGKIRLGPFIRGERDKRQYQQFFTNAGTIAGLRRIFLLLKSNKISAEIYRFSKDRVKISRTTLICFSDMNHLERLIGRHEEVRNELYRITRHKYWPDRLPQHFIGIHIRMGDFPQKSESNKTVYFRQPLEWYAEALQQLRISMGSNLLAMIFSDGTDKELTSILKIKNVIRSPFSAAISDLLAIAESTVLITSRSSYSLFGAYLGQVPTVWYEGKKSISGGFMPDNLSKTHEIEWMPGQMFSSEFIGIILKRASTPNNQLV